MNISRVSVIGLGKLGAPILVALASRGFNSIGVDILKKNIDEINSASYHFSESDFDKLLVENRKKIRATSDYNQAIINSDITLVVVPTPSTSNGSFSNQYVLKAIEKIGKVLQNKKSFHIVAIVSTVLPGSMQQAIQPILEKNAKKTCGKDFGLCYNPTFVALGSVIKNFLYPDVILIGESDKKTGLILTNFYRKLCMNHPEIKRVNYINAEIAKLALNTFITTKISYANMLAQLCEKLPGADVDEVTDILGFDSRIGHKYLKGALPYGGPCFPRDNKALTYVGKKNGLNLLLPEITDTINNNQIKRIITLVTDKIPGKRTISILGLTYRTNTDVFEESAGLKLAIILAKKGYAITAYDPNIPTLKGKISNKKIKIVRSINDEFTKADCIILALPLTEANNLKISLLKNKPLLIDCWKIITSAKIKSLVNYYAIGVYKTN